MQKLINYFYFNDKFLQENAVPQDFFNAIAHSINLEELYKVKKHKFYSDSFTYCPVLLEVVDSTLKDQLDGLYLLQIWDHHKRVFELKLKSEPKIWDVSSHFFFWQPGTLDDENDKLFFMDLNKPDFSLTISNLFADLDYSFACFYDDQKVLAIANHEQIKLLRLVFDEDILGTRQIHYDAEDLSMRIIESRLPILGIFDMTFVFETADNQLDFNKLSLNGFDDSDSFYFEFDQ
mmetsp:Transcript_28426/g.27388  ORF Transcript_28426/g.27388 Transcript_28426/m.27388 type:complete len:234 (+) Transcript_28426:92-793(+)